MREKSAVAPKLQCTSRSSHYLRVLQSPAIGELQFDIGSLAGDALAAVEDIDVEGTLAPIMAEYNIDTSSLGSVATSFQQLPPSQQSDL